MLSFRFEKYMITLSHRCKAIWEGMFPSSLGCLVCPSGPMGFCNHRRRFAALRTMMGHPQDSRRISSVGKIIERRSFPTSPLIRSNRMFAASIPKVSVGWRTAKMLGVIMSAKSKSSKDKNGTSNPGLLPIWRIPLSVSIVQTEFMALTQGLRCCGWAPWW